MRLKIFLLIRARTKNEAVRTPYILLVCELVSSQTFAIVERLKLMPNNRLNKQQQERLKSYSFSYI